jgi:hypothetical protein
MNWALLGEVVSVAGIAWVFWELMSLLVADPYDPELEEYVRPPVGLVEWYLRRRAA